MPQVMVVDDSEVSRGFLKIFLSGFGMKVVCAKSGAEAVDLFQQDRGYDLILMKIEMPCMNGVTATRIIRKMQMTKRPFIAGISSEGGQSEDVLGSGMDFLVIKPSDRREVMPLVSNMEQRCAMGP